MLNQNDMELSDQQIRARIHRDRVQWGRRALAGESHGFLIVAVSAQIAFARPDVRLHQLASNLCGLYLGTSDPDTIHLDHLMLDTPSGLWQWKVGVNYFSAQADGRWWRDHRIPGAWSFR